MYKIGQGLDIHPFIAGRPFVLGGVTIPHPYGLEGHSDADALLHAVVDAILGALGEGDIGTIFKNNDMQWKDAPSSLFLEEAYRRLTTAGYTINNIDATILCEAPKLTPHFPEMKRIIATILKIQPTLIALKATTTERLGFVGRGEGVLASVVVLLRSVSAP
jgi:2-C-methyl-D-erythritol 2,4-cyclodiphosphate synthase